MRLYNQNAEALLLAKAKSIQEQPNSWRAIYLDFTSRKDPYSEGLRSYAVTNILKDLLESEDGYVYLCADGDVFILFQGKVSDIMNRLGEHFQGLGDGTTSSADEAIYTVFDLSMQWDHFFTLCERKATEAEAANEKSDQPAFVPAHKPLREIDADILSAAAARRSNRKRMQVLVVEDDPFTRRLVVSTLKADYDVIEADDGATALTAYEGHAPDAVFLDIELPDTNGHVVLNKLLNADKSAFVIMLSANSMKENILAALEKGAQGFVTKPFAKEKLMHYLRQCETMRSNRLSIKTGGVRA